MLRNLLCTLPQLSLLHCLYIKSTNICEKLQLLLVNWFCCPWQRFSQRQYFFLYAHMGHCESLDTSSGKLSILTCRWDSATHCTNTKFIKPALPSWINLLPIRDFGLPFIIYWQTKKGRDLLCITYVISQCHYLSVLVLTLR